jgi:hypothetical protein
MQVITKKINVEEALENNGIFEIEVPEGTITLRAYNVIKFGLGQVIYFYSDKSKKKTEKKKFLAIIADNKIKNEKGYKYIYRGIVTGYVFGIYNGVNYDGFVDVLIFEMIKEK